MKIVDGLPYYTFYELEKMLPKIPSHGNNLTWSKYYMDSYKYLFIDWIRQFFDYNANIEDAEDSLKESIIHNIDYIRIKHCKIT